MILARLFYEFFKIGLFAIGGGMATIPFLKALSVSSGWYPLSFITDMIAISEATPGPMGINMATYVGYNVAGFIGGITATFGEILPSIIIVTVVSRYLEKFRESTLVNNAFYGLRPAVTGLIAAAGFDVLKLSVINVEAFIASHSFTALISPAKLILFAAVFVGLRKFKLSPILCIVISAFAGVVFAL